MGYWLLFIILIAAPLAAADKPLWQQEWERIVSEAKKEGKVAVTGPGGAEARAALVAIRTYTEEAQRRRDELSPLPIEIFGR